MTKFFVPGVPVPQGSMRAFNNRIVHSNKKTLMEWRKQISAIAENKTDVHEGAVWIDIEFYLPKPVTVTRRHPHVKPDIDKLARAVLDALTGIAYKDDSQVVSLFAIKKYAQDEPGVMIEIQNLSQGDTYE